MKWILIIHNKLKYNLKPALLLGFGNLFLLAFFGFKNVPPAEDGAVLFYIQRSVNASTIIYELNVNENNELDINEPVKIYWKNYATDNSVEPLNYIQRKYVYGIDIKMVDMEKKMFCFNFVSYKKKKIFLMKPATGSRHQAFCDISGSLAILSSIFIQIDGDTFWVPKIRYVEITGESLQSGESVSEKIIP